MRSHTGMACYEHIIVLPNNDVKCTLCDDILEDSDRLIELHLHERKHKELYMKSLILTNNITIGTTDLFCYLCNCNIATSELVSHVQSLLHQSIFKSIKELVKLDGGFIFLPQKTSSLPSAYCTICDRDIEFIQNSVKNHIVSTKHMRAKAMVLQPLNGIFSVKGNDKYLWCKICQIFFDNYIELIIQHVEESDHAVKIKKILRMIYGQDICIEKYLQDHKEDKAFCKKCDIEVPCNIDNLQSHINGKKHKSEKATK